MKNKILLCDDEIHIVRAAEIKLLRSGYDVVCTTDGEEAWDSIVRSCPDILITDCQMPRLDGLGLVRRIRQHEETEHLPVVILTAKGYELVPSELFENWGVLAVVPKPFSPRELVRCVEQILETGRYVAPSPAI
jgi:DNA-binding response OmpR family regulator